MFDGGGKVLQIKELDKSCSIHCFHLFSVILIIMARNQAVSSHFPEFSFLFFSFFLRCSDGFSILVDLKTVKPYIVIKGIENH
jgi:hypothetical protein